MTITTRLYHKGRLDEADFDPDRIDHELKDADSLVWVDLDEPNDADIDMLGREFGFHPLALEDCKHPHQRPKVEQYETYFFVVAYGTSLDGTDLVEHEMAIFVGRNCLVTVRKPPAFPIAHVLSRWDAHPELTAEGGGYLLYVLLDQIVDGYFDILENYEERSEEIENEVFGGEVDHSVQTEMFHLKKDLIQFRRRTAPLRDVLDVMQRQTIEVVTRPLEPYYRDVYDHVLRVTDFADNARDILSSALDASLAVVNNRLNEVMKRLTSWASIILVPTLIAGVYGMNFRHMPELNWLFGYPFALGLMAASAGGLYWMFKRRDWL